MSKVHDPRAEEDAVSQTVKAYPIARTDDGMTLAWHVRTSSCGDQVFIASIHAKIDGSGRPIGARWESSRTRWDRNWLTHSQFWTALYTPTEERDMAPEEYRLPDGWCWGRVVMHRAVHGIAQRRLPLGSGGGAIAWGVPL